MRVGAGDLWDGRDNECLKILDGAADHDNILVIAGSALKFSAKTQAASLR